MNILILKRFRNELTILVALLFTLGAFYYKVSANSFVADKQESIEQSISDISRVAELKKLWGSKKIGQEAKKFKTIVSADKVKSFKKTSQKVKVNYSGLNIAELNRITKSIMNTPFQITKLVINERSKESYEMELVCRW